MHIFLAPPFNYRDSHKQLFPYLGNMSSVILDFYDKAVLWRGWRLKNKSFWKGKVCVCVLEVKT